MTKTKGLLFTAGIVLATAFIFSCDSGGGGGTGGNGNGNGNGGGNGTWTAVTDSSITDIYSIYAIGYGNNRWVAGGFDGQMAYSSDGINWTAVTNTFILDQIHAIVYGNGRFVTGETYSSDGVTWTKAEKQFRCSAIAYGDGTFVAVGGRGRMAYSTDGVIWTAVENSTFGTSTNDDIRAIAYGGGKWVAGNENGKMAYSTDNGITWTPVADSKFGDSEIQDIAYGDNRFIAVGDDGKMAYSTDGISWTADNTFADNTYDRYINAIAYGGGKFVIRWLEQHVSTFAKSDKFAYSSDGINWTDGEDGKFGQSNGQINHVWDIAYGGGKFIAVGGGGKMAYWKP